MRILLVLPLICMCSCSKNSGGPTSVGELASMVVAAPVILPFAAMHYSVPIQGDKRLRKSTVLGKWYKSPEDIPDKPYIEFHGKWRMILPSHDVGSPDGTVTRGSEIGNRSPGKEDFWELNNSVNDYYRNVSIKFHYHDRDEAEEWRGVQVSGKEMTGEKTIGGLRIKTQPQWQNISKYEKFRLYRE